MDERSRRQRGAGRFGARAGLGALVLVAVALLGWLLTRERDRTGDRERSGARENATATRAEDDNPEAATRLEGAGDAAAVEGAEATSTTSTPALEINDRETAIRVLRQALLDAARLAKTDLEVLDADRLLSKALIANPDLAAEVAKLLPELDNRKLAFRIGLMLGRYRLDPEVHAALIAALQGEDGLGKEAAAYAFYGVRGDLEAAGVLAEGFTQSQSADVRSAHAFALSSMILDLPPEQRSVVRAEARGVVGDASRPPELRAEALSLLDPHLEDRERLRDVLADERSPEVVMAAARILANAGEDEVTVTDAIRRLADEGATSELVATSIRAMLEDYEKTYGPGREARRRAAAGNAPPPGAGAGE